MGLNMRVSVSMQDIDAFRRRSPTPIIDEVAAKALPVLLSDHISQILLLVDLAEPFYLSFEHHRSQNTSSGYSAMGRPFQSRAIIPSETHPNDRSLYETHDPIDQICGGLF